MGFAGAGVEDGDAFGARVGAGELDGLGFGVGVGVVAVVVKVTELELGLDPILLNAAT